MRSVVENHVLSESVSTVPRVGIAIAARLKKLDIETIGDALRHLPVRYEDYSKVSDVHALEGGQYATVRVRVQQLRGRRGMRRRAMHIVEALVADDTGSIRVVWFGQPYIMKSLAVGDEIFITGKVQSDGFGLHYVSPTYEKTSKSEILHTARIVPIYALTAGISQKQFRLLIKSVLDRIAAAGSDIEWLPMEIRGMNRLLDLCKAYHVIHFPENLAEADGARHRLQFDAALLHELNQRVVTRYNESVHGCALPMDVAVVKACIATLPFALTDDQKKAVFTILKDMERHHPMNRLLQGDVGSGKTVVAAIIMCHAAAHGCTSILLAPTQLLAEQHMATLQKILEPSGVPVVLRTAHTKQKKIKLPKEPCVVVGTHALLYDNTLYPQLGLVVVDEQHRFGVAQRKAIKQKNKAGYAPHFLSMSATPIPRSLALAMYGSLSVSLIKQLPVGRQRTITRVVDSAQRNRAIAFVCEQIAVGGQVFVVAPLIDPSDALSVESATELFEQMKNDTFKNARVALVHGRMKPSERSVVMDAMRRGDIDVLVATAVIEVGVDIPNASVMWIEGAERFGLAQLHQFRGRVGRGARQSYCMLFSSSQSSRARERLALMEKIRDGFTLAEKDLELRGAGERWGIAQSGFSELDFLRTIDIDTVERARRAADIIMADALLRETSAPLARQLAHFEAQVHRE